MQIQDSEQEYLYKWQGITGKICLNQNQDNQTFH